MAPYLQKYLGQPVQIINKAGAGAQLGHTYFLQQPDDGYTILSSSVNYIPLNIGITKAPYKLQDFEMVNLPSNDSTIFATASDSKFKTIEQVIDALKKDFVRFPLEIPFNFNKKAQWKTLALPRRTS